MTSEEAIRKIEYGLEMETTEPTPFGQLTVVHTEALRIALSTLRAQQELECQQALTIEELRGMAGEPVWCAKYQCYGIVKVETVGSWANMPFLVGAWHDFERGVAVDFEYDIVGRGLTLYRSRPAGGD